MAVLKFLCYSPIIGRVCVHAQISPVSKILRPRVLRWWGGLLMSSVSVMWSPALCADMDMHVSLSPRGSVHAPVHCCLQFVSGHFPLCVCLCSSSCLSPASHLQFDLFVAQHSLPFSCPSQLSIKYLFIVVESAAVRLALSSWVSSATTGSFEKCFK